MILCNNNNTYIKKNLNLIKTDEKKYKVVKLEFVVMLKVIFIIVSYNQINF